MKKLWNSIGVVLLIFFCIMTSASHIANKFFQKDIGSLVIGEINLDQQVDTIFQQIETYVPNLDKEAFLNLKDEIQNNKEANEIFGVASKAMLDDIVNNNEKNQDMKAVLKDLLYSYDNQLEKVLTPLVTKEQIHTFIDTGLTYTPIQEVYNISVESFKESIPENYMKLLKIINFISQEIIFIGSIIFAFCIAGILILMNLHKCKWTFSIGMAGISSGVALLIAGQIVPKLYQTMLQQLDRVFTSLMNSDFTLITIYGAVYLIVGSLSLAVYFIMNKKEKAY